MQPRITNPAMTVPGVMDALQALSNAAIQAADQAGLPPETIQLVGLRASQINGCAACLDRHSRDALKAGETAERLAVLAAWRDTAYFTGPERAALALTEAGTRIADQTDRVPDDVWDQAARHYNERALAALVTVIAAINAWNRINVVSGQVTGRATARQSG